jgi:hypothetical protein
MSRLEKPLEIEGYDALDELLEAFFPIVHCSAFAPMTVAITPQRSSPTRIGLVRELRHQHHKERPYTRGPYLASHSLAISLSTLSPRHFVCRAFRL